MIQSRKALGHGRRTSTAVSVAASLARIKSTKPREPGSQCPPPRPGGSSPNVVSIVDELFGK
eukprot:scaffold28279_cov31-Tisochrysis_lutea.AAC.3